MTVLCFLSARPLFSRMRKTANTRTEGFKKQTKYIDKSCFLPTRHRRRYYPSVVLIVRYVIHNSSLRIGYQRPPSTSAQIARGDSLHGDWTKRLNLRQSRSNRTDGCCRDAGLVVAIPQRETAELGLICVRSVRSDGNVRRSFCLMLGCGDAREH